MTFQAAFKESIQAHYARLKDLPVAVVEKKPAPNKWSPKEIIGHLIDSACNNHRRFVQTQWKEKMVFDGYQQDKWVTAQAYQNANWQELLDLWHSYNLHICRIMENTSPEKLEKEVKEHNLHLVAMVTVPATESVSLGYFMKDYIFHIEHHLKQIYYLSES